MSFFTDPFVWLSVAYLAFVKILIDRGFSGASTLKSSKSDQKCPHCGTWQSGCDGWLWVGNSENPEIDFVAICGECRMESRWVWVGPGICVTFEEINKPKRKSTPPGDE